MTDLSLLLSDARRDRLAAIRQLATPITADAAFVLRRLLFTDRDAHVRAAAARALTSWAGAEPWLLEKITDRAPLVRDALVRALARCGSPAAFPALRELAERDSIWWVRRAAIYGLASLAPTPCPQDELATFTRTLADPFWRVRHAAVRVLSLLGARDPDVRDAIVADATPSSTLAFLRGTWGPAGIDAPSRSTAPSALPAALLDPDPAVVTARIPIDPDVTPVALVELLCDPHAPLRDAAIERLVAAGDLDAFEAALDWLEEPRIPHVVDTVIDLLDRLGEPALAIAERALARRDRPAAARWAAAWIVSTHAETLYDTVLDRANEPDADTELRRPLLTIASEPELVAWANAALELDGPPLSLIDDIAAELHGRRDFDGLLSLDAARPRVRALQVDAAARRRDFEHVALAASDAHHAPRAIAARWLVRKHHCDASVFAADPDPTVREAALSGIVAEHGPAAIPAALAGLADPDPAVRRIAIHALSVAARCVATDGRAIDPSTADAATADVATTVAATAESATAESATAVAATAVAATAVAATAVAANATAANATAANATAANATAANATAANATAANATAANATAANATAANATAANATAANATAANATAANATAANATAANATAANATAANATAANATAANATAANATAANATAANATAANATAANAAAASAAIFASSQFIDACLAALEARDPAIRRTACELPLDDDRVLAAVIARTADPDDGVRAAAAEALERLDSSDIRVRALLDSSIARRRTRTLAFAWLLRRLDDAAIELARSAYAHETDDDVRTLLMGVIAAGQMLGSELVVDSKHAGSIDARPIAAVEDSPAELPVLAEASDLTSADVTAPTWARIELTPAEDGQDMTRAVTTVERRPFGRAGFDVAPLAISGAFDLPRAGLDLAEASGIDTFFWEPGYDVLGRWLRGKPSRRVISGTYHADGASIRADVERALKQLRRDTLDAFLLFWTRSPARLDASAFAMLDRLKRDGKIRAAGFSTHHRELAREAIEHRDWDVVMIRHSAAHPGIESELLPTARERDTAIVTFSALTYGRLTSGPNAPTPAECYRYSLAQSGVTACISAPRRTEELVENLEALAHPTMEHERQLQLRAHGVGVRMESARVNTLLRQPTRDAAAAAREMLASEPAPTRDLQVPLPTAARRSRARLGGGRRRR